MSTRRQKTDTNEWELEEEESVEVTQHVEVPEPIIIPSVDVEELKRQKHQEYLKRQERRNIKQLQAQLKEYESRQLSQAEQRDYERLKQIHDVIEAEPEKVYELPSDYLTLTGKIDNKRKVEVLNAKEEPQRKKFDNLWENDQLRKAKSLVHGNIDEITVDSNQYEYVFDESQFVEFDSDKISGDHLVAKDVKPTQKQLIDDVRKSLPAYQYRQAFLDIVKQNQIVVVVGETGSGKTTQLPQYLYEEGYCDTPEGKKIIGCTQPRRVAATSVATRVADEMHVKLGQEVGYSIRFEDETSPKTVIKYLTDGILLREFLTDASLSNYSALIIDEAHERTISTEILLSLLKDVTKQRPDLKLIVASATINAEKFSSFFDQAPIFKIPGRRFPVDIHYTKQPEANYIQAAINTIFLIHTKKPLGGDILVFLTGQDEIETMQESLIEAKNSLNSSVAELIICPIYANLPNDLQKKIFEPTPPNARKVVLATNIAETSITIDGIKYVIDSGYVKENVYNPSTGMDSLVVVPCSQASADQRAGRAGRVGPGECFRLYTKWSFSNELLKNPTPEILRGNLISTVLLLLSLGVNDLVNFDFMDPPSSETLIKCLELLYAIGALNSKGQLTKTGRLMSEFPIDPLFSKCLISSQKFGVIEDIIIIISMLGESSSLFYRPKDKRDEADKKKQSFTDSNGDHLTLLNVWNQWKDTEFSSLWCQDNYIQYKTLKRVKEVKEQLTSLCTKNGIVNTITSSEHEKITLILKAITAGFFPHVVRLSKMGDSYRSIKKNQPVYIHPSSALFPIKPPPKLLLYHELVLTSKEYMRNCMLVQSEWLQELAPHYFSDKDLESVSSKPINRFK